MHSKLTTMLLNTSLNVPTTDMSMKQSDQITIKLRRNLILFCLEKVLPRMLRTVFLNNLKISSKPMMMP
jgi:hypothetical protein